MECLKDYEILLGTYEAFVLGYKLSEDRKPKLETSIADHAHAGSIRCITAADKFLITSGGDEIVKIFNLRNRSEHGTLGKFRLLSCPRWLCENQNKRMQVFINKKTFKNIL